MIEEINENFSTEPLKVSVLREELVKLTGDSNKAIVLNQFLYWSERTKSASNFIKEEMIRLKEYTSNGDVSVLEYLESDLKQGWIYKSGEEMIKDTMLTVSKSTMNRIIKSLIDSKWICKRKNPRYSGDNTPQYRVNLLQIQIDLYSIGYSLNGYRLIMNFVDLAKLENLKEKINESNSTEKPIKIKSNQNEPSLSQNESRSNHFEPSSDQNEPTLPEITSKTISEINQTNKKNDDEIYNTSHMLSDPNQNEMLTEILSTTTSYPEFLPLLKTLRLHKIDVKDIYEILNYFKVNPEMFDKEIIKQQLSWMALKKDTDVGISSFSKYFITGIENRTQSKKINNINLDEYLGITTDELPEVPMFNWLKND